MKKSILVLSLFIILSLGGLSIAIAQDQPKGQKDTVNMDTNAKPEYYYAVEDEKTGKKGSGTTIAIVAGAVVVVGVAGFFLLRKKKK